MIKKIIISLFAIVLLVFNLYAEKKVFFEKNTSIVNKKDEKISPLEKLGIEIVSLRLTAYGKLIDLRYKVIDEQRASIIFNPKVKPYLLDPRTGYKYYIPNTPKVGSLRSYGTPIKNRVYFMLFGNNGSLKKGSIINIAIGDTVIENLVIE